MSEKKAYERKAQAKLDEWRADLAKLKAQADGADADAEIELHRRIEQLESRIEQGESRLAELSAASDEAWESLKQGFEESWQSLDSAFKDAVSKFKA